jgi:putative ABC transport system permease protein
MRQIRAFLLRLGGLFHKERRDREVAEEIESNLQLHIEDNLRAGMSPEDARREAVLKLGGIESAKEAYRDRRGLPLLETLAQDLRYTFRQIVKYPGFVAIVVLTLGLGTGATTAIFSVVNTVLLRPLPYRDPSRLVWVVQRYSLSLGSGFVLGPDYRAWRGENSSFEEIEAFGGGAPDISLASKGTAIAVRSTGVTPRFFSMLGINPILGRSFTDEEGAEGRNQVVLLSEGIWRTQFGSDPNILGSIIRLNGAAKTVVGVLPGNVRYPEGDLWTPISLDTSMFTAGSRPIAIVNVIGRLKEGITYSQAESDLNVVEHRLDNQYQQWVVQTRDRSAQAIALNAFLVRNVRSLLLILLGVAGFVLLIACANVSNLLLSRATGRGREFAIRAALGAGRIRLIRQSLTESLVLASLGSALGFLGGLWFVGFLNRLIPEGIPASIRLDPVMFGFAVGIAIFTTLVCGLVPALVASRTTVSEALKSGGQQTGTGGGARLLRNVLVIFEIALSLILLIGAGLLVQTFVRLSDVRLGFNPHNILTTRVTRPMTDGHNTPSQQPFFDQVIDRLKTLPGVVAVGAETRAPLSSCQSGSLRLRDGEHTLDSVCQNWINPDYFRALGISLLSGRFFDANDKSTTSSVVIINRALAHVVSGDQDPIGHEVGLGGLSGITWAKIVGVVGDMRNNTLEQEPSPEIYIPYNQSLLPAFPLSMTFVVRTSPNPLSLANDVRKAVQAVDQDQAVSSIQTLDEVIKAATVMQRFRMALLGFFALLAFVLAILGIFGVMSYSVGQRRREMAVRVAIGAQRSSVIWLVVRQGMSVAAFGLAGGILGALGLTRFLANFLYDVKPTDIITFLAAVLLLTGASFVACYLPARRASSVDPVKALRVE